MNTTQNLAYGYLIKTSVNASHSNRNYGGRSKIIHVLTVRENGIVEPLCSPTDAGIPSDSKTDADVTCERCKETGVKTLKLSSNMIRIHLDANREATGINMED